MKTTKILITIAIVPAMFLGSCGPTGTVQISDQQITSVIAIGTGLTFKYVLTNPAKRTVIARYISGIAGGARALTGNESDADVAKLLASYVPAGVLSQYPEIGTIVIPQVIGYYDSAKNQFGAGTKSFLDRMNAVATGLEQGVAEYLETGHVTVTP